MILNWTNDGHIYGHAEHVLCCQLYLLLRGMTLFFNHHKWIFFFFLHKSVELVSGPTDSSVLLVSCSKWFHRLMMHCLGMLGSPTSQKAQLKARMYWLSRTLSCGYEFWLAWRQTANTKLLQWLFWMLPFLQSLWRPHQCVIDLLGQNDCSSKDVPCLWVGWGNHCLWTSHTTKRDAHDQ